MTDDRMGVEIDASGSADGIRELIDQLRTFAETLDEDTRYQMEAEIWEKIDD